MDEKIAKRRGWAVQYEDGNVIAEWNFEKPFSQLPDQHKIVKVGIFYADRHWFINGKRNYFAEKTESILLGPFGDFSGARFIEARTIGFWDEQGRKIKFTVNERTGEAHGPYLAEG